MLYTCYNKVNKFRNQTHDLHMWNSFRLDLILGITLGYGK